MTQTEYLSILMYCLENNFPAPVTIALLNLARADDGANLLIEAHKVWTAWTYITAVLLNHSFDDVVRVVTGAECTFCDDCNRVVWNDNTSATEGDRIVCDDCIENYTMCSSCEELSKDTRYHSGNHYCQNCFENQFGWCEECGEWFHDDDEHNHDDDEDESCECEAPHPRFEFPANGNGVVKQNERLTVELPKGTIDEAGIARIRNLLVDRLIYEEELLRHSDLTRIFDEVGALWQSKRGNFTRRLSSALFKQHKVKLTPAMISEIGNIGRAHSSEGATWHVEFTRDLNEGAAYFYHEESCWWTSHYTSRCSLKNWGGLGLRTFEEGGERAWPSGRIWVQPLNEWLHVTHDALNAHAYVVFNGYGELNGYVAARIIGHLTGKTYRKVGLDVDYQYVNGDTGYLVADETTCAATDKLRFAYEQHDTQDARVFALNLKAAA